MEDSNVTEGTKLIAFKEVGKMVPEEYNKQHRRHWILKEVIWNFLLTVTKVSIRIQLMIRSGLFFKVKLLHTHAISSHSHRSVSMLGC